MASAKEAISKGVAKAKKPIIAQHGDKLASAQNLRMSIDDILQDAGILDDTGKLVRENLKSIAAPKRKALLSNLVKIRGSFKDGLTIKQLNQVTEDLQSLANFGSATRTAEDSSFRS